MELLLVPFYCTMGLFCYRSATIALLLSLCCCRYAVIAMLLSLSLLSLSLLLLFYYRYRSSSSIIAIAPLLSLSLLLCYCSRSSVIASEIKISSVIFKMLHYIIHIIFYHSSECNIMWTLIDICNKSTKGNLRSTDLEFLKQSIIINLHM
jgi:hypothetical protein